MELIRQLGKFIAPHVGILIPVGIVLVIIFWIALFSHVIVKQGEHAIIEHLGAFAYVIDKPGIHLKWPWDRVALQMHVHRFILLDMEPIECRTLDNVSITVDTYTYYRVVSMKDAFYKIDDYKEALIITIETTLYEAVRNLRVNEIDNATLDAALMKIKKQAPWREWGIEVSELRIQKIELPRSIANATENQVTERHRALVEQQRAEADLVLERQRVDADLAIKKQKLAAELEQQHLQTEIELEKNRRDVQALNQYREAGLLKSYLTLERLEAWRDAMGHAFGGKKGRNHIFMTNGNSASFPLMMPPAMLAMDPDEIDSASSDQDESDHAQEPPPPPLNNRKPLNRARRQTIGSANE